MRTTIHFACVFGIVFAMHKNASCSEEQTCPIVAGRRESKEAGIQAATKAFITRLIT